MLNVGSIGDSIVQKIWIDRTYFITVDNDGYVLDEDCLEGALGCIIKVRGRPTADVQSIRALKIPRFLADTTRENAFIDTLLQNEFNVTQKIFSEASSGGFAGLLTAGESGIPPTRTPVPGFVQHGRDGAGVEMKDGVLAFRFDKSKPPRVACIRVADGELEVIPDIPALHELGVNPQVLEAIQEIQRTDPFTQTTHILKQGKPGIESAACERLTSYLETDVSETGVWFTMPPSVLYTWGHGNLQEVISRGYLADWDFHKHLVLCQTVLQGLSILHQKHLLHGDIRPANVMHIGDRAAPSHYVLIDYGSFNKAPSAVSIDVAGGQTLLGPSVRPERQSPFYSKERRIASEFESADTAFIVKDVPIAKSSNSASSTGVLIRLGWRNSFSDLRSSNVDGTSKKETLIGSLRESAKKMGPNGHDNPSSELVKDDLIRLREFVFEIVATRRDGEFLDVLCKQECYKVVHDRISIPADLDGIEDGSFLAVPRVIEMRQLSCATDLYSIGVLFLYTVFCGKAFASAEETRDSTAPKNEAIRIEKEFREFVATLENTTYFLQFWPRISRVCEQLDLCFERLDANLQEHKYESVQVDEGKTVNLVEVVLTTELVALVERIAYSVPGVKRMLKVLNNNIAHFVLFIRFVLCCMHRRSELSNMKNFPQMPFCKDRLSKYEENATAAAIKSLNTIQQIVNREYFAPFDGYDIKVPDDIRDLKPAADLDAEVRGLKAKLQSESSRVRELEKSIQIVHDELSDGHIVRRLKPVKTVLSELSKHTTDRSKTVNVVDPPREFNAD